MLSVVKLIIVMIGGSGEVGGAIEYNEINYEHYNVLFYLLQQ